MCGLSFTHLPDLPFSIFGLCPAAVKWVLQEEASPWAFFKFKLLAIVVIVGMAASVFYCFCKRDSSEEASKGDTDTEPLVDKQEHV